MAPVRIAECILHKSGLNDIDDGKEGLVMCGEYTYALLSSYRSTFYEYMTYVYVGFMTKSHAKNTMIHPGRGQPNGTSALADHSNLSRTIPYCLSSCQ